MPRAVKRWLGILCVVVVTLVFAAATTSAQEASVDEIAKANNPLADMKAFNLQNYYIPKLYGIDNQVANTFWFQFSPLGTPTAISRRYSTPTVGTDRASR
jgi:hypothetical protein